MMNMASISSKYSHRDHSRKSPLRQSLKNPSRISITLPNSSPLRASERKLAVKAKIEELLECMICLGRANNPQMCPSCSNLCCYSCIKRWLTEKKSQCPRCGRDLRVSQLINCKLMTDIASAVDNMEMYRPKDKTTVEICTAHNVELSYYCKECKVPVCSDCAIFGQEHKGHEFQHISKVYDQQVELIKAEEKALNARINNLVGSLSAVEANIQKITDMKEEKAIELEAVIDQMSQRLDSEFKSKILALLAQKGSTGDEIEFLKAMERELEEQIAHPVQNKLVVKTKELVRMLRDVAGKPLPKLNKASMNTELISEVVPSFASSTFLLNQYSVLKRTEEVVYSDPLTESGMSWRLKVYPSGRGNAKGTHISVFLERIKGSEDPREFEYRVELVNQKNPEICLKRESISELESTECWGYTRFYRIELLEQDGYILPHKDTLMFKFYVRSPNYFHQAEIQQKYIKYLEEAKSKSTALTSQLKTKFKEERERTEKKKDPNLRYEQRTSDKPSNSGDATNEGTSFKDKIEKASEDEEQKYESLNTVRPVSSGHEDNDQEGTARKIWDDSASSRIQPQISAMVKDRTDEGDHASYVESEGPISGEREGLSYQDLFGKKEKLDMGRRDMVKKGADKVSPRQKDYYRRDKGLLQGLGGMKMKTEANGSKDDAWDEFEGLGLKQEKSHIGQKDSYDYDALHPIDLEAIFGHQNEEEKRIKDHKSKDKYAINKKKVLRDPSLFLLPESVNKKLNNLKTVDVRKSLNIEKKGNQDLLNGLEKENLPSYF